MSEVIRWGIPNKEDRAIHPAAIEHLNRLQWVFLDPDQDSSPSRKSPGWEVVPASRLVYSQSEGPAEAIAVVGPAYIGDHRVLVQIRRAWEEDSIEADQDVTTAERSPGQESTTEGSPQTNPLATTGLILGILSIFFAFVGFVPILAIVFSGIGLSRSSTRRDAGKTQAWIGLVLGIVYTLVYLNSYGYFD